MGSMSRNKGKVGEREVAALLREMGFENARRGVQYQGGHDSDDVIGLPGFHVEVKRTEKLSLYEALGQAHEDAGEAATPVVFHRRSHLPWVVVIDAEAFLKLVGEAQRDAEQAAMYRGLAA